MSKILDDDHCVEKVKILTFSSLYFPEFSPNTGRYGPEKTSLFGHFLSCGIVLNLSYAESELMLEFSKSWSTTVRLLFSIYINKYKIANA